MTLIQIKVKPNARQSLLEHDEDGNWRAQLKSPPVDGKANRELIALVASEFGVAKSRIQVKSGASGRIKRVQIEE